MGKDCFIGVDLTSAAKKPTACVALDWELHLTLLNFLLSDGQIIEAIERYQPSIVAIDAPLSLPNGLCCLEESCPCQSLSSAKGRVCERELSRRRIPCYYTTKKSIIKNMVYRGMALKDEITARGYQVIEVYPYAAKVRLFGDMTEGGRYLSTGVRIPLARAGALGLKSALDPTTVAY